MKAGAQQVSQSPMEAIAQRGDRTRMFLSRFGSQSGVSAKVNVGLPPSPLVRAADTERVRHSGAELRLFPGK
jgi:hypothetical protein